MQRQQFPDGFVWGVATAAYQIEGAVEQDGRKPCVWDMWSRQPGTVTDGDTGRYACDHYHRFESDLDLMVELGVKHYRLSLSWPRIMPDGRGAVNEKGVDFYKRLLDAMAQRGITPWVTLFHWDSPYALHEEYRTWLDRRIADDFAAYCEQAVRRLGDRCTRWMTINEIPCFTRQGYGVRKEPNKAPGMVVDRLKDVEQAVYHGVLAHGKAVQAVRAASPGPCQVGLVDNVNVVVPLTETEADEAAALAAFRRINGGIAAPVLTGRHDPGYLEDLGEEAPDITDADLPIMNQPLDFFGLNLYTAGTVRAADNRRGYDEIPFSPSHPKMGTDWLLLQPDMLYWGVRGMTHGFNQPDLPLYVTETGCATGDRMARDGHVYDTDRVLILRENFRAAHRAIDEGCPLKGIFVWSFMDNFEWEKGYSQRFGIVHNHYETQTRTPKLSADWYRQVMRENRVL